MDRRSFLQTTAAVAGGCLLPPGFRLAAAPTTKRPKLSFYGSTRQVSGSCHLLETSIGLIVVDCGLFYADIANHRKENLEFPFDPKEVKAFFLTHGHVDHNGRLPLLYEKGLRCPIYATDCTRDITKVMLDMSAGTASINDEEDPLYKIESVEPTMGLIEAVPYNTKISKSGLTFRFTDAGHILGSAMVEIWIDGVKILFGGDMGPDTTPILCSPTQHYGADAVLVESTYGPTARDMVSYEEFGQRIMKVIRNGGSVLIPAFALHKTQCLLYVLHKLMADQVIDPKIPIYSDSATAQKITEIYHRYIEYHDSEARKFAAEKKSLFYLHRYREVRPTESLQTHGSGEPAIYISTSGMLDHATAPKHLWHMAKNEKNAVFLVGYQSPDSVGKKLQSGEKQIGIPWEEWTKETGMKREIRPTEIKLQVEKQSGFSSHARGQQILEWLHEFQSVGAVYVVHGDEERAVGLADAMKKMGVPAFAPKRGETFEVGTNDRVKPGAVPPLENRVVEPAPVDK